MANVLFKRGSSTNLLSKSFQVQDGVFYLTNDTNRLYVGNGTNLAEINRYIVTVENKENLPAQASIEDFVYIKNGNIFAVCTSKDDKGNAVWTQINSVEIEQGLATDTYVSGVSFNPDGETPGKYNLTLNIVSKNAQESTTPLAPLTASLTIPVINVGLVSEATTNGAKLKITGTGSNENDTIDIVGAGGVSITRSNDGKTITATGKTYSLGLNGTSIGLKNAADNFETDKIEVIDDDKWIEVSNSDNKLAIKHASGSVTQSMGTKTSLPNGTDFDVITGITTDGNHITGYTTTRFTAKDTDTTYTLVGKTENENVIIELKDQTETVRSTATIDVAHKITIDDEELTVKPGKELPAIYSKAALDNKFKGLNAMTYKGTISSADQMAGIIEGALGDTYKVSNNFTTTINGTVYSLYVGDLLIVNGTEDADGKVTNIKWDQIETGERSDTTYTLSAANNKITLTSSTNSKNDLTLSDDDIVILSSAGNTISANHKTQSIQKSTDEENPDHGGDFTAITEITDDEHGHITSYKTTTYTLPGEDKIEINTSSKKLIFRNSKDEQQGSLQFLHGTDISITGSTVTGETNGFTAAIKHADVKRTDPDKLVPDSLPYGGQFDIVESISTSNTGHVTAVQTKQITLPAKVTYSLQDVAVANNKATWELKNNLEETLGSVKINSTSLNIAKDTTDAGNDTINVEMIWGSF